MDKSDFEKREYIVNTDLEGIRKRRGINQYNFEKEIPLKMLGKSIAERYFAVREGIFDKIKNVKGANPLQMISNTTVEWPNRKLVAELYLPQFYKFIDSEDERIAHISDPEKKSEEGFRFAAVNYLLGTTIHQATDGNGQTYRMITLSYIWANCPEYRGHYFPIKYEAETKKNLPVIRYPRLPFYPLPNDMDEKDMELVRLTEKLSDNSEEFLSKETMENYIKSLEGQGIEVDNAKELLYRNEISSARLSSTISVGRKLENRYPGYFFTPHYRQDKERNKSTILTKLIASEDGREKLSEYISTGRINLNAKSDFDNAIYQWTQNTLDSLIEQNKKILSLEDQKEHDEEFSRIISQD